MPWDPQVAYEQASPYAGSTNVACLESSQLAKHKATNATQSHVIGLTRMQLSRAPSRGVSRSTFDSSWQDYGCGRLCDISRGAGRLLRSSLIAQSPSFVSSS